MSSPSIHNPPYPSRRYAGLLFFFSSSHLLWPSWIARLSPSLLAPCNVILAWRHSNWLAIRYPCFFYAFAAIPIASLADTRSRKHIIAIGVFFWSLMTIICGLTKNYTQIFLARIGVGVGEATLTPSTTSLIGDYFPREDVPLAMSIFQAGPIIGTGIAFIVGGFVLQLVEGASLWFCQ